MAKFVSTYPGTLIMADGTEIAPKDTIELSKEAAAHAAVAEWIDLGWLVPANKVAAAAVSEDIGVLRSELDAAKGTVTSLTAELEAERAKTAAAGERIAELEVALEEATKPPAPPAT